MKIAASIYMAGRKRKEYGEVHADFCITSESGLMFVLVGIVLFCAFCKSTNLRSAGTRKRKNTRVPAIRCANPDCVNRNGNQGPQFSPHTSGNMKVLVEKDLKTMIHRLYVKGVHGSTVADEYGVSSSFVSFLRDEIDKAIERGVIRDRLVEHPVDDAAVSIDETFFEIESVTVYVIIVRGYKSTKVLGINVSEHRAEDDIKKAFDEAQGNTTCTITTITCDAWSATRTMAHALGYPLTLIIHPHKEPYEKAIIEHVDYTPETREITQAGVNTDIFTRRGKREYKYMQVSEPLSPPPKRPRGRPKGSRNKPKSKSKPAKTDKKKHARGIFKVFSSGKKGYVRVFPGQKRLLFPGNVLPAVQQGMNDAMALFAGKYIQNNWSEGINNIIRLLARLMGIRSVEKFNRRIRTFFIMRNDEPEITDKVFPRRHRANIFLNNHSGGAFHNDLARLEMQLTIWG
jgi:hypothetical protein